jgi:hypothetical protein
MGAQHGCIWRKWRHQRKWLGVNEIWRNGVKWRWRRRVNIGVQLALGMAWRQWLSAGCLIGGIWRIGGKLALAKKQQLAASLKSCYHFAAHHQPVETMAWRQRIIIGNSAIGARRQQWRRSWRKKAKRNGGVSAAAHGAASKLALNESAGGALCRQSVAKIMKAEKASAHVKYQSWRSWRNAWQSAARNENQASAA